MEYHLVLRVIAKFIIPLILIFALYVQFHGDYGPGGGFQAGVIFASGFILYSLIFGIVNVRRVVQLGLLRTIAALGLLFYIGVGIAGLLAGGNFLEYGVLAEDAVAGQVIGIMLVEVGVGVTVASVMMIMFFVFSRP